MKPLSVPSFPLKHKTHPIEVMRKSALLYVVRECGSDIMIMSKTKALRMYAELVHKHDEMEERAMRANRIPAEARDNAPANVARHM